MLFISHKSEDKAIANEVLRRALDRGYSNKQLFLDSDPESGIEAAAEWERKIYGSLKHSRAMIVLCSPNWLQSHWCFVEIGYAKALAITIFPIVIADCELGSTLSSIQAIDLTNATDAAARNVAFERLWRALENQHLGPKDNLPWPPKDETDICPFPGLICFEEKFAPVFYGRDAERDTVINRLRLMRSSGVPRLLMIVGGSGSGKSSLLRAGVLPRLSHPGETGDWLVLPTLRYGETPNDDMSMLARLAEIIEQRFPLGHPKRPDWKRLREQFESDNVEQATRDFADAVVDLGLSYPREDGPTYAQEQFRTVLLPIDQFEELLIHVDRPSSKTFLRFLQTLLSRSNGRLLVIGTMRSDYLDTYEQHAHSLRPPFLELYRLPPFDWAQVTEVIVRPAERVDVAFTEELVKQLKGDAPNSDALPLLAFTLEKLFRQRSVRGEISLDDYKLLGGMMGAITRAVSRILPQDISKATEQALRQCFVSHLCQVDEKDEFVRRRALWDTLPEAAKPIIEKFVSVERLLTRSGSKGEFVEVTHEAIFRCWNQLRNWLQEDLPALRLHRRIKTWAEEWEQSHNAAQPSGDEELLLTPGQLASLDEWLKQGDLELPQQELLYISESRKKCESDQEREIERLRQLAEAEEEKREAETRRANDAVKFLWGLGLLTVSLAAAAFVAGWAFLDASRRRIEADRSSVIANRERQISELRLIATESASCRASYPQRSLLLAIYGYSEARKVGIALPQLDQTLRDSLQSCTGLGLFTRNVTRQIAFTPDNKLVALSDDEIETWDLAASPIPIKSSTSRKLESLASLKPNAMVTLSRDGLHYAEARDGRISVRRTLSGELVSEYPLENQPVSTRLFQVSPGNPLVALSDSESGFSVFKDGTKNSPEQRASFVNSLSLSPTGRSLATLSFNRLSVWSLEDGGPTFVAETDPAMFLKPTEQVLEILFAQEDQTLIVVTRNANVYVWTTDNESTFDVASPTPVWPALAPSAPAPSAPAPPAPAPPAPAPPAPAPPAPDSKIDVAIAPLAPASNSPASAPFSIFSRPPACISLMKDSTANITTAAVTPDAKLVILGFDDRVVRVWDKDHVFTTADTKPLWELTGAEDSVSELAVSSDNRWVAIATAQDTTLRLWDLIEGSDASHQIICRPESMLTALTISPEGKLFCGFENGSVKAWELNAGKTGAEMLIKGNVPIASLLCNANEQLFVGKRDGSVEICELHRVLDSHRFIPSKTATATTALAYDSASKCLLLAKRGSASEGLSEIVSETIGTSLGKMIGEMFAEAVGETVSAATGSTSEKPPEQLPETKSLPTNEVKSRLDVWRISETDEPSLEKTLLDLDHRLRTVRFSPDHKWLAAGTQESAFLWKLENDEVKEPALILPVFANELCFSPDSQFFAICGGELIGSELLVFEQSNNSFLPTPLFHASNLEIMSKIAFTEKAGDLCYAAGSIVNVLTFEKEQSWKTKQKHSLRHDYRVECLAVSSDEAWLATGASNGEITLWNLKANEVAKSQVVLRGHRSSLKFVAFTDDSRWLVTGSDDGMVCKWPLQIDDPVQSGLRAAGRNLGYGEWNRFVRSVPFRKFDQSIPFSIDDELELFRDAIALKHVSDQKVKQYFYERCIPWLEDSDEETALFFAIVSVLDDYRGSVNPLIQGYLSRFPETEEIVLALAIDHASRGEFESAKKELVRALDIVQNVEPPSQTNAKAEATAVTDDANQGVELLSRLPEWIDAVTHQRNPFDQATRKWLRELLEFNVAM